MKSVVKSSQLNADIGVANTQKMEDEGYKEVQNDKDTQGQEQPPLTEMPPGRHWKVTRTVNFRSQWAAAVRRETGSGNLFVCVFVSNFLLVLSLPILQIGVRVEF